MKKYKTILLDQDGVLCGFTTAVIKQLNSVTGMNVTLEQAVRESNWDLEKLWGLTQKEWWEAIDEDPNFWLKIPMFPWANKLYENLKYFADEVVILTAPSQNPMCIAHKMIWLKENMGIPSRNIITGKKKYLLARSDTLLIDDAPHNCEPFIENGGNAVCIPSDWNTIDLNYEMVWEKIVTHLNRKDYEIGY